MRPLNEATRANQLCLTTTCFPCLTTWMTTNWGGDSGDDSSSDDDDSDDSDDTGGDDDAGDSQDQDEQDDDSGQPDADAETPDWKTIRKCFPTRQMPTPTLPLRILKRTPGTGPTRTTKNQLKISLAATSSLAKRWQTNSAVRAFSRFTDAGFLHAFDSVQPGITTQSVLSKAAATWRRSAL